MTLCDDGLRYCLLVMLLTFTCQLRTLEHAEVGEGVASIETKHGIARNHFVVDQGSLLLAGGLAFTRAQNGVLVLERQASLRRGVSGISLPAVGRNAVASRAGRP